MIGFCVVILDEVLVLWVVGFVEFILVFGIMELEYVLLVVEKDILLVVGM